MTRPDHPGDIEWFHRTKERGGEGHCGACGQPGRACICRTPCGCAELHPVGAGIGAEAAEVFADPAGEQPDLFGADS